MIAPCTCGSLAKWVRDIEVPIVKGNSGFLLDDGSIDDPRLTIHFCPFCGEHGGAEGWNHPCECGVMESLAKDYPHLLEFDSEMNEFHILHSDRNGKLQVYHCISCGGNPPQSQRHTFFEAPSESDYNDAWAKVADLKNENDFIHKFGVPTHVFEIPPMPEKDIEIYGIKPVKKQWTFEPTGSLISYCLLLMTDGTYQKSLGPKAK